MRHLCTWAWLWGEPPKWSAAYTSMAWWAGKSWQSQAKLAGTSSKEAWKLSSWGDWPLREMPWVQAIMWLGRWRNNSNIKGASVSCQAQWVGIFANIIWGLWSPSPHILSQSLFPLEINGGNLVPVNQSSGKYQATQKNQCFAYSLCFPLHLVDRCWVRKTDAWTQYYHIGRKTFTSHVISPDTIPLASEIYLIKAPRQTPKHCWQ